jgi:glycosyltransferase involved in cell wall biosynthesis
LKVLLTSHQFPPKFTFGTEKLTFESGRELHRRGHEVYVLTTDPDLEHGEVEDYVHEGISVRAVGHRPNRTPDPLRYEFDNPEMAERMCRYVREVGPDLLHVWHAGRLSGSIIPAAKSEGLPVVFTATDFWSICRVIHLRRADTGELCEGPNANATNCLRCFIARANAPQRRKDLYLNRSEAVFRTYSAVANNELVRRTGYGRRVRAVSDRISFLREAINSCERVIAPTKITREMLENNGIHGGKLLVSRYGIETSHISSLSKSPECPETVRFGFMGGLVRHKGVHNLLEAFQRVPEENTAELKIYGDPNRDPEYFAELKEAAGGDSRVRFMGPFVGERVGEVLQEVDVLVVPSSWYENTPLVIYEAFASGTPVVGTDLGGISEVVHHDYNGLLFTMDDAEDLGLQLRQFVEDPDLIARLRANVEPPRTVGESVDELEGIYRELSG